MAKLGETDARWIVSPRSDGKNVDNWHWTEKDLFPWCKQEFEKAFKKLKVPSDIASLKINKAESIKGSMIVCNRKGKTIFVYDVQLKLDWEGELTEQPENADKKSYTGKGTIHVDDISNDEDKWKWSVKMDDETALNKPVKEEMRKNVGTLIDQIVSNILNEMKVNRPVKEEIGPTESPLTLSQPVKTGSRMISAGPSTDPSRDSTPEVRKMFVQSVYFETTPAILYEAFVDDSLVRSFAGEQSMVCNSVGGDFIYFDGILHGKNVEFEVHKKIVQKLRYNNWPQNIYSNVTLQFNTEENGTRLILTHTEIPASHFEQTRNRWESLFWRRLKSLFGWQYQIST